MKKNINATILATAYAVNPYKGSEDGTGWNILMEIARHQKVIAITRENNQADIDHYFSTNTIPHADNIQFEYFDLPYYLRFWKKKSRGALLYSYLWQLSIVFFIYRKQFKFDIAHHLNFHSDWMPSFLWLLSKPLVWGPIGHHPKIPRDFILKAGGESAYLLDRLKWFSKKMFWTFDPFLRITKWKASKIICINSSVKKTLALPEEKIVLLPAVATQAPSTTTRNTNEFQVLSIGRFVHLKGFDLTIKSFAEFYFAQSEKDRASIKLILIGKGPLKSELQKMTSKLKIEKSVTFIDWIDRKDLDQYFANASIFLFPSHEGAGMVVPEALSFGVPVVCLDNIGPGEFIDKRCGIKINSTKRDLAVPALSEKLNLLYRNHTYLKLLSYGAKEHFKNKFTWERKGNVITEVYSHIIPQNLKKSTNISFPS